MFTRLGLPMIRYTFVQNAFARKCRLRLPDSHSRTSRTIRIFLQRSADETLKSTHTHTHLDLPMHFDFPERMCMHQSPPPPLSLSLYICKNGLDPDQTRMEFRKECFVNLKICACDRKQAVLYKSRCAR